MNQKEQIYCKMIGKAIRELRQDVKEKSLCMFAYENDIPRSTLSRIEIGDNEPKLVTLKKIAEGFGWSLSELFQHIEDKLPENFKIFDEEHY
uniref:HTH cro/C1-type domain-containing protein n=1 Tax=uncultured Candidatus Melainabacteria bacterium TaxID=2682970 RepID=A0A650EK44_9BACT|nr:hypothetical protein Melaina855_1990 [uncultured Candidatus Melainabacteria bacterium]